jgi:hypothetical protein
MEPKEKNALEIPEDKRTGAEHRMARLGKKTTIRPRLLHFAPSPKFTTMEQP